MYRLYLDIRDRLGEPLWHDEQGVPRYAPYHPSLGGIYDRWSALLEIRCQGCGRTFQVSDSYSLMDMIRVRWNARNEPDFPDAKNGGGSFGFGDAPWHEYAGAGGQCSGTTMTTDTVRVVEFWTHDGGDHGMEWRRRPEYECDYSELLDEAQDVQVGTD